MHDPAQKMKFRESFILSDTCGASSIFQLATDVHNTYMLGTSGATEKATSYD